MHEGRGVRGESFDAAHSDIIPPGCLTVLLQSSDPCARRPAQYRRRSKRKPTTTTGTATKKKDTRREDQSRDERQLIRERAVRSDWIGLGSDGIARLSCLCSHHSAVVSMSLQSHGLHGRPMETSSAHQTETRKHARQKMEQQRMSDL